MLKMKKEVGKENSTMHTDVISKSPCFAPNFCTSVVTVLAGCCFM